MTRPDALVDPAEAARRLTAEPPVTRYVPRPGLLGRVNWLGLWSLYLREVRRFASVWAQTLVGPVVTSLLLLAVLVLVLRDRQILSGSVSFLEFVVPGIVMMAMMQNAFSNTSSTILISKVQGTMNDILMAPLSATELVVAYALGGATRALAVGVILLAVISPFVGLGMVNAGLILFNAVFAALIMALLGLIAGLWSEKMDHVGAAQSFVVMPLTMLSGTFFSIERFPDALRLVAQLNPVFYMIDGFRAGFIGRSEAVPALNIVILLVLTVGLGALVIRLFHIGYKIRT